MTAFTLNFNDNEIEIINAETLRVIEEVQNNIGLSREFTNINDLMNDLNA